MEREFTNYNEMTAREIIFTDFKEFGAGNLRCGWSTVATLNIEERDKIKTRLDDFMKSFDNQNLDMFFIKLHEIENYSAEMLAYGVGAAEILAEALGTDNFVLERNIPNKKIARAIAMAA